MGLGSLSPDTVISDLLAEYPECIRAFINHKMLCVGCPVARFHTVSYACEEHNVDLSLFLGALHSAMLLDH